MWGLPGNTKPARRIFDRHVEVDFWFWVLVVGPVLLNVAASLKCIRANDEEPMRIGSFEDDPVGRRRLQLALIWIVPVVGALTILALHGKPRERLSPSSNGPMGPTGTSLYDG